MDYTPPVICSRKGSISKPWYIEFYYKNQRIRIKNGSPFKIPGIGNRATNRKERQIYFQKLQQAVSDKLANGWNPIQKIESKSLADAIKFFLQSNKPYLSTSTYNDYKYKSAELIQFLPNQIEANKITKLHITNFLNSKPNLKISSKNVYLRTFSAIFSRLLADNIISQNPVSGIKKHKTISKNHKTYPPELAAKVLTAAKAHAPNLYLCCLLEYYCFLRPKFEIRLLQKENFNLKNQSVTITSTDAKSDKTRTIPLNQNLIPILQTQLDASDNYLFQGKKKNQPVNDCYFQKQFTRLRKKIEIPKGYTLYSFKHTGVCDLYQATKDIYLVSKMCGHSSISTTEIYLRSLGVDTNFLDNSKLPDITV